MQNIVEKLIKLTDLEDSIIEDSYDDDAYEEVEVVEPLQQHTTESNKTAESVPMDEIISAGVQVQIPDITSQNSQGDLQIST